MGATSRPSDGAREHMPAVPARRPWRREKKAPIAMGRLFVDVSRLPAIAAVAAAAVVRTGLAGTRFVDGDAAFLQLDTVQLLDGGAGFESFGISTKPKPLERPVSRSMTILTESTAPWFSKTERSSSSRIP